MVPIEPRGLIVYASEAQKQENSLLLQTHKASSDQKELFQHG